MGLTLEIHINEKDIFTSIHLNYGRAGALLGTLFGLSILIFIALVLQVAIDPKGLGIDEITDFLRENILGNLMILIPGLLSIFLAGGLVALWFNMQKWKDLRYKMAFYLYHSKVQKDQIIPLEHLAKVAVSTMQEITITLQRMISLDELKGLVDETKGVYIHKGLTRRTMRILTALPPARLQQLDDVKRWALKAAEGYSMDEEGLEELEPVDISDLPPISEKISLKEVGEKRPCPDCGKMNRVSDHFCTFCGEVID
jgi:hypothetical protein